MSNFLFGVAAGIMAVLVAMLLNVGLSAPEPKAPVSCAGREIATTTASGFTFIGCPDRPFIWLHSYEPPPARHADPSSPHHVPEEK
jgi:hypothetical protein